MKGRVELRGEIMSWARGRRGREVGRAADIIRGSEYYKEWG